MLWTFQTTPKRQGYSRYHKSKYFCSTPTATASVTPCYFADVHPNTSHGAPELCDGDVDVADVQTVAGCWEQPAGTPLCPITLDLTGNGTIDILNVIAAANEWGWHSP